MTHYISFRSSPVGGKILARPLALAGDGTAVPLALEALDHDALAARVSGKDILFAVHGFNVGLALGANQMTLIERALALPPSAMFLGVLWPGDFVLPVVNYPFEADDAVICGRRLAELCNGALASAASVSFFSHSLGGRLVLEAVSRLQKKARTVCLTAAAVDRNVLTHQYAAALRNAEQVSVLSSRKDWVLQLAYPGGDFLSDLFGDGDSPFRGALGLKGPRPAAGPTVGDHKVPVGQPPCEHNSYMPGGSHFAEVAQFTKRCFDRLPQTWPFAA